MATKDRPTLAGEKFKTRKRDEKTKFDSSAFAEQLITGMNETDGSLEEIAKYLDQTGGQLDYRRYAETLFDVLIAGGTLAPGGKITSSPRADVCVFTCEPMVEAVRGHVQLFTKLALQRYKYLQKSLIEEMLKILKFLKAFTDDERRSLAIFTALSLSVSLVPASVISSLLTEALLIRKVPHMYLLSLTRLYPRTEVIVKEGLSLTFATTMFQTWVSERGIGHISSVLRKKSLENRLLELLPSTRRSPTHFDQHFNKEGLEVLVKFRRAQENAASRKKLQEEISEVLSRDEDLKLTHEDVIKCCQEHMLSTSLTDSDVCVMLWKCVMDSVEWNKKEELVAEQALKHLKAYCPVFVPFCEQGTPQLTLLIKMQEFCYDNMYFMKTFHKIVLLFYNKDVITEQAILKWYNDSHLAKGKSVFLSQMKPMVDWLQTAEEESDSETKDPQTDTT